MFRVCRIGRHPQNELVISDRIAADFHAELEIDEQKRIWINDLHSHYGTLVNSRKVSRQELLGNDTLQIGFTTIDWKKIARQLLKEQPEKESLPSVLSIPLFPVKKKVPGYLLLLGYLLLIIAGMFAAGMFAGYVIK